MGESRNDKQKNRAAHKASQYKYCFPWVSAFLRYLPLKVARIPGCGKVQSRSYCYLSAHAEYLIASQWSALGKVQRESVNSRGKAKEKQGENLEKEYTSKWVEVGNRNFAGSFFSTRQS